MFVADVPPPPITLRVVAHVTPNRAGTPAHPQGVKLSGTAYVTMPADYDPPLVQNVDVWLPRAGVFNGGRYPKCSQDTLARSGPSACPKGSIMGAGSGVATADTVKTYPKITIVNGGAKIVYFYTVMTNPARVQAPVPATVTRLASGPWGYRVHATIPRILQIVAGIPIKLEQLSLHGGRGTWIATTSCPSDHRWPYKAKVTFDTAAPIDYASSVACRPARR